MLKIKPLTEEQILISIDRLTRFKYPEIKYLRVFKDIISSNLIEPKYKKSELDEMDYGEIRDLAQKIINYSLDCVGLNVENDLEINAVLKEYENVIFKMDVNTLKLLDNKINYQACYPLLKKSEALNLKWLCKIIEKEDITTARQEKSLRYPVEKVVIAEGITEEILLPEFARLCGYDFDKNGVYIISAGGKNQVVKLFYNLADYLKIPVFILLDKDAEQNYEEIKPKLSKHDKVHLLDCGEFEDALPLELIERTLTDTLKNISITEPFEPDTRMTKTLEEIFKHKGMHEFKKSEFAHMVREHLRSKNDVSEEIKGVIKEIQKL